MNLSDFNKITEQFSNSEQMPVLFLGHGSPMNAIEENEFVNGWRNAGIGLPRPNAILCVSAHWETNGTFVTAMEKPRTIHDFGGFPNELYQVQYPAPGSFYLANETKKIISSTEIGLDQKWGLDHGCWSVVKHIYPNADVPIVQMSLDCSKGAEYHFNLAKQLLLLRKKGVLILGSGNLVHNLRMIAWDKMNEDDYGFDWAIEASDKIKKFIMDGNFRCLIDYKKQGKAFDLAIPSPEHYLPLLYVMAMKQENEKITMFNDKAVGGSLTMTSLKIESDK